MKTTNLKKVVIGVTILATTFVPALGATLSDVQSDNTFYEYITALADAGVVSGYSDGTFKPSETVSRGAMSKFVMNGLGFEVYTECEDFPDVNPDHTFYEYITTLKCEGVIGGYSDGEFKSDNEVTRGAAMKFIVEGARQAMSNTKFLPNTGDPTFSDLSVDHTFFDYVMSAHSNEIVGGYSDGTFKPDNPVTRGAMSKMVHNTRVTMDLAEEIVIVEPPVTTMTPEERDDQRSSDINAIITALTQYRLNGNSFPQEIVDETRICIHAADSCEDGVSLDYLVPTYLSDIPKDPSYDCDCGYTGYTITISGNQMTVYAPLAEVGGTISKLRYLNL